MFFSYEHLSFRYEPFPIGLASPLMEEGIYQDLLESYPPLELFKSMSKIGHKYSLSEKNNQRQYRSLIRSHPRWREFHRWIKSDEFIHGVMTALKEHHIDLGYKASSTSAMWQLVKRLQTVGRGQKGGGLGKLRSLRSRFEFSMLPADGGYVRPHTDAPSKIVTLIVAMVREGEWESAFGGGTDINRPKTTALSFNLLNCKADFHEMEVLHTYDFLPNQAVVFVKTFNSWHSVPPMAEAGYTATRTTLTITITVRPSTLPAL
jgi:hypothetical protein